MNIPETRVSTIKITQTSFELKTIIGLKQLETPAAKKNQKDIGNKQLTKNFFSNKFREIQVKTYTQIMWYIQNYCSSNVFRNNYF